MADYNEDEEVFEKRLEDKKHREMMKLFRDLLSSIQRSHESDAKIREAIDGNAKNMELFFDKLNQITHTVEVKAPDVRIETNQDKVVMELKIIAAAMMTSFSQMQEALSKPRHDWEFFVNRGANGFIESVTAIQK